MKITMPDEVLAPLEVEAAKLERDAAEREGEAANARLKMQAIAKNAAELRGQARWMRRAIAMLKGESLAKSAGGTGGVKGQKRLAKAPEAPVGFRLAGVTQERIVESAIREVADEFEVSVENVRGRDSKFRHERALAMFVAMELGATMALVGECFDGRTFQSVGPTAAAFEKKLERDRDLKALAASLKDRAAERARVVK